MAAAMSWRCSPPEPPPEVWEREPDYYVQHDVLGHVHKANARRHTQVQEHPAGEVTFVTEGRGFRADADVTVPKPPDTWRLLVLGDSHIDGVVNNSESVTAALSTRLMVRARESGFTGRVEVVNGGTGHWGPPQYGAAPGVWAELEADACLVVVYEGNDYLDALAAEERAGLRMLKRSEDHFERLFAAQEVVGEQVSQQLNQDLVLATEPEVAQDALALTLTALEQAAAHCAISVAVLPTPAAVHPPTVAQRTYIAQALGLSPHARLSGRKLSGELLGALADRGVPSVDTWPWLHAERHGLPADDGVKRGAVRVFWEADQHLSTHGHRALAQAVDAALGPVWWPAAPE